MSGERTSGSWRRRTAMRRLALGGALAGVVGVAGAGAASFGGREPTAGAPADVPRVTATVRRGTLVEAATLAAELDHGPETPVRVRATGTVTWLPAPGTVVARGGAVARVDDRPVVLLYGDVPSYRDLALNSAPPAEPGATTPAQQPAPAQPAGPPRGRDVRQLETNLAALGYTGFDVDEVFTSATATAVRRWQEDIGAPVTGAVAAGDVVYVRGPVRVARPLVGVGDDAGGNLLAGTGTERVVSVAAPAGATSWAVRGAAVTVALPDGRTVAGRVRDVGPAAPVAAEAAASPTVRVVVAVPDQRALGSLSSAPVTVRYVVRERRNVLVVPVTALVALAEGGYGVEVVDGPTTRYTAVEVGLFADGQVEVSGADLRAGLVVTVAE